MMKHMSMGKYTLIDQIAKGGMAEVYLAQNHMGGELKKLVAVKKILPHFSDDPEFVAMFKDEAKVLLKMNHKNIISTSDFGIHEGQFYLIMEYIRGKNLREVLLQHSEKNKRIPIALALYIAREVAQGLQYVHDFQDYITNEKFHIVHRDISPINIMISFDGHIKIIDFGIAKTENRIEVTRGGIIKGKLGYMSPEQALGSDVDHRTDIFSLGIVLWETLAHRRLMGENSGLISQEKYRNLQVPTFKDLQIKIPFSIERIVRKSLEVQPENRYKSISEMLKDLNLVISTLFSELSERDLSSYLCDLFNHELQTSQGQHRQLIKTPEESERTECLMNANSALNPSRTFKFRNHVKIRWPKKGADL